MREVASAPDAFPIRTGVDVVVTSRDPIPEGDGYGAADAMIEVLVDAGVLADERLVATERFVLNPGSLGYSIDVEVEEEGQ